MNSCFLMVLFHSNVSKLEELLGKLNWQRKPGIAEQWKSCTETMKYEHAFHFSKPSILLLLQEGTGFDD